MHFQKNIYRYLSGAYFFFVYQVFSFLPSRGTASEVLVMWFDTNKEKTVWDSKIVTSGIEIFGFFRSFSIYTYVESRVVECGRQTTTRKVKSSSDIRNVHKIERRGIVFFFVLDIPPSLGSTYETFFFLCSRIKLFFFSIFTIVCLFHSTMTLDMFSIRHCRQMFAMYNMFVAAESAEDWNSYHFMYLYVDFSRWRFFFVSFLLRNVLRSGSCLKF